jgi:excisionase family DNA binding protein
MTQAFLTVEQAAEELKLHPKTVLRYIREHRLPAARIGKSYRITRGDLDVFSGIARGGAAPLQRVKTTCIVDIPDIGIERAQRLATFLQSAALTGSAETPTLSLQTAFDRASAAMKLVLIGSPSDVARLLGMIELQLGSLA